MALGYAQGGPLRTPAPAGPRPRGTRASHCPAAAAAQGFVGWVCFFPIASWTFSFDSLSLFLRAFPASSRYPATVLRLFRTPSSCSEMKRSLCRPQGAGGHLSASQTTCPCMWMESDRLVIHPHTPPPSHIVLKSVSREQDVWKPVVTGKLCKGSATIGNE